MKNESVYPECFTANEMAYPLCIGGKSDECEECNLYENYENNEEED